MTALQQSLFDPATTPPSAEPGRRAIARQRWWRLAGRARRSGRAVEPVLVTPHWLARIDVPVCPVTRAPLGEHGAQVVALRDDASVAAGHLATVGARAARVHGASWQQAWHSARQLAAGQAGAQDQGLDAAAWRRMALLRSFVQPLTPLQVSILPLHLLPPPRLRVLSPVQSLQVLTTLALEGAEPARRLARVAALAEGAAQRDALHVFVLTLLARRPSGLETLKQVAQRHALEDLWDEPLLARRWQRVAERMGDGQAQRLLQQARQEGLLGTGWRMMDTDAAVDGWDLPGAGAPRLVG